MPPREDVKLRGELRRRARLDRSAAHAAKDTRQLLGGQAGFLEAEGELERTFKVTQHELAQNLDVAAARQSWSLALGESAPYAVRYSRNGRHLLMGGARGHLSLLDALRTTLVTELHLGEPLRDVCFLHNETMLAAAQRKYVYIYDSSGVEIHCIRQHIEPHRLQFLPHHFLLASVGNAGYLKYHDVSVGNLVAEHRTKLGVCDCMTQNPQNAVVHLGHANGVATLWTPVMSTPLVRMLCHRGPVSALAVDPEGRYMASSGLDGRLKVWDLRTYKMVHSYALRTPATAIDISQRGLMGVTCCGRVQIWKDALAVKASAPYLEHSLPAGAQAHRLQFRPFEDSLVIGHSRGVSSIVVPGAGEPNYDALEANPFESRQQRREAEVASLLDKLAPETITLAPAVGTVDRAPAELLREQKALGDDGSRPASETKERKKTRGRSKLSMKLKKKRKNVIDLEKAKLIEKLEEEKKRRRIDEGSQDPSNDAPGALRRFSAGKAKSR